LIYFQGRKDILIAKIINNKLEVIKFELLPLYLQRNDNIEQWFASRTVDSRRVNSRLLKRAL